jgi:hypothetical protein
MKSIILSVLLYTVILPQTQTDIPWPTLADSPWPMIKHDPQLTGRSPYRGPQSPTIIWTVDMPHGIFSGPVIGEDSNLYFGLNLLIYIHPIAVYPHIFTVMTVMVIFCGSITFRINAHHIIVEQFY